MAQAAAGSIGTLKDQEAAGPLLAALAQGSAFARGAILRGLKELRSDEALGPAVGALQDVDPEVRVQAVGVVGWLKREEALPALIGATRDPEPAVRRAAVSALTFSARPTPPRPPSRHWPIPMAGARDRCRDPGRDRPDPRVRPAHGPAARRVLASAAEGGAQPGAAQGEGGRGAICQLLDHPVANLRKEAAAALGEIADPLASAALERHLDDPDPDVRKNLRWALQRVLVA